MSWALLITNIFINVGIQALGCILLLILAVFTNRVGNALAAVAVITAIVGPVSITLLSPIWMVSYKEWIVANSEKALLYPWLLTLVINIIVGSALFIFAGPSKKAGTMFLVYTGPIVFVLICFGFKYGWSIFKNIF